MKDKKILYGIIIAFVFLLSIGLTYAYFSVTTTVVGDRNAIQATVGTLNILYTDGPEITANNIEPGWTTEKTIKVENTGTLKAYYSLIWSSLTNEITSDELVLEGTCTSDIGTCDNIPTQSIGSDEIVYGIGIDPGEEQTYVITLTFIETGSAQNYNQEKAFNGVLNVVGANESYTLMGTLLDLNGDSIGGATIELHSTLRTGITDPEGNFEIRGIELGSHEINVKNLSNESIAIDNITLLSGAEATVEGKNITALKDKEKINLTIKLNNTNTIEEIKVNIFLKDKILSDNTVYRDDTSSLYVISETGVNFTVKSTLTNGQGLYTNNKLEDGENTYFRGGSFCAYTSYENEDASGTYCKAIGGTWSNRKCSLDTNRVACQAQGYTYYDLKNNVTFAGHAWRIIRIDENNNIRMILADASVSTTKYNNSSSNNAYMGYKYGTVPNTNYNMAHANTNNSAIKTYADNWYTSNLSGYSSHLSDAGYCNDRSLYSGLGYEGYETYYGPYARNGFASTNPRISCPNVPKDLFTLKVDKGGTSGYGNNALDYPIGLITADEAKYAGILYSGLNFTSYLKFNQTYWTMSPEHYLVNYSAVFCVTFYGYFNTNMVDLANGFNPSISLKPNTLVSNGTGTYDDPYVIE